MQNAAKSKIWTWEFIIIFAFHFVVMFSMYSTLVTVGSVAIDEYGISPSTAGLVASIFIVGVLLGRALSGYQVNRIGAKKLMYIGTVLFFVTYILYFLEGGLYLLIAARLLNGIATGMVSTAMNTLATISVPETRRGEGISYFSLSMVIGAAIGPFLSFLLLERISFHTMLAGVGVLVLLMSLLLPMVKVNNFLKGEKKRTAKFVMIDRKVLPLGSSILFMGFAYSAVLSFLNIFAQQRDLVTAASIFFIVYSVTILMTRPVTGKLLDNRGANTILYPAFIVMAIGFIVLGQATTGFTLLLSAVLIGLGFGNHQSVSQAVCVKIADKENVGLATSTYFIMLETGLGFGPFLLGYIVPFVGYGGLYEWLVVSIGISMVIYFFVYGRHEKRNEPTY
jgi:MFS family permease